MPRSVRPQLAALAKSIPAGDDLLHEIKYDGWRMMCRVDFADVRFYSRNLRNWTEELAALVEAVSKHAPESG
jgi:bifunctional non-homologous end joining protein LigD